MPPTLALVALKNRLRPNISWKSFCADSFDHKQEKREKPAFHMTASERSRHRSNGSIPRESNVCAICDARLTVFQNSAFWIRSGLSVGVSFTREKRLIFLPQDHTGGTNGDFRCWKHTSINRGRISFSDSRRET